MTRQGRPLRVLAIGDPYMPVTSFTDALASLGEAVTVTEMQIDRTDAEQPRTESERRLREYAGDPAKVAAAVAGHDVVVVHGAPVSSEALDVPGLRLVCCARGGPVNVDVAAATERGIPVATTPGKNAEAVAELTIAFALMLIRGVPRASRYVADGGTLAESNYEVDIQVAAPRPEARLQFADAGLELLVRYPVEIRKAPDIDEEMTRKVLELIETDAALKASVAGIPKIRSAVKG